MKRGKENCVGGLKHSQTRISSENWGMWNVYTSTIYNLSEDKVSGTLCLYCRVDGCFSGENVFNLWGTVDKSLDWD